MKTRSSLSTLCSGILLISSVFMSCKKDVIPETSSRGFGKISYFVKASSPVAKTLAFSAVDTTTTVDVAWSSASVYVEKISFTGKTNSLIDTTIIVEKNLDIFSTDALAGVFKLPSGSYKGVEVKMFCKKSLKSELAFKFRGTFTNTSGGTDSVLVGSSLPFQANLTITEIVIDPSDNCKATFNFDLNKVLTGISTHVLQSAGVYVGKDGKKMYSIFKGGSEDPRYYDQVLRNWQTVASVIVTKE